ncbi:MAG: CCA tRNA nucleotidyltransferase [Bacteroidota bacterium]
MEKNVPGDINFTDKNLKDYLSDQKVFGLIPGLAEKLGVQVFIVGGFVRDIILQRERSEADLLVIGSGIEFATALAGELKIKKISVYRNFGTAHFRHNDFDLEFVGARKESYDRGSRNPVVETGTFSDDINRRDFTINTLAISLNKDDYGALIDTFNGLQDMKDGILRTPLDPFVTFNDDPLRMMRAVRFASQLNFTIPDNLVDIIKQLAARLEIISQERITDEFMKILSSPKPSVGLLYMYRSGLLDRVLPEISAMYGVEQRKDFHHKDVFLHTCQVIDNVAEVTDDIWLRFSALMHDVAKPATKKFIEGTGWTFHGHEEIGARMMDKIFYRLKLPLNKKPYVEKLIRLHLRPIALVDEDVTDSAIRRLIVAAGEDLEDLITLCRADITSKNPQKVSKYLSNYEIVMNKVREVEEKDRLRAFQSPVRGEEIMEICGLEPSRKVGELKKAIEEAILDGKIENNYEQARKYLMEIKDSFLNQ